MALGKEVAVGRVQKQIQAATGLKPQSTPDPRFESDKQSARDAGAQGYLTKPEGILNLVAEVARLIAEAKIAFPVAVDLPQ